MNKRRILAAVAALIGIPFAVIVVQAWQEGAPGRERARIEQRLRAIDVGLRSEAGDLIRDRADCQATETENAEHQALGETCWETFKLLQRAREVRVKALHAEQAKLQERLSALR